MIVGHFLSLDVVSKDQGFELEEGELRAMYCIKRMGWMKVEYISRPSPPRSYSQAVR